MASLASAVAANPDIMEEILLWLPPKSIIRFKSVCKQWHELLSTPLFAATHTRRNPHKISGFLSWACSNSRKVYETSLPLGGGVACAFPEACTFKDCDHNCILKCCHGLVLGIGLPSGDLRSFWVYNPTTRQHRILPNTEHRINYMVLAFSPSRSHNYRVIAASYRPEHVEVYRSEINSWEPFVEIPCLKHMNSHYYDGILYCLKASDGSLIAVDIERRSVEKMITHPPPMHEEFKAIQLCGSRRGRLNLLRHNYFELDVDGVVEVLEMTKDQSKWLLLHKIQIADLLTPTMQYPNIIRAICRDVCIDAVYFLLVEGQEEDEDDKIVVSVDWDVVAYNLRSHTRHVLFSITQPKVMELYACANTLAAP